ATTWTTIANAPARFKLETDRTTWVSFPIHWPERELFAVAALPVIAVAIRHSVVASGANLFVLLLGAFGGLLVAVVGVRWVSRTEVTVRHAIRHPDASAWARRLDGVLHWLAERPNIGDGYVEADGSVRPGHVQAALVFTVSLLLYGAIGISKF